MVEVCAFSLESCLTAQKAGASRIELCGGMFEGGTTPSGGLIRLAVGSVQIPIYVMIRPRGGDFCYSDSEFDLMKEDIQLAKQLGANGLVFGILNPNGSIDTKRTKELVELAKPLGVTFHRAFDVTNDPFEALEDVILCGCERILTSGQKNVAIDGLDLIGKLVVQANNRIEVMAGSGVNAQNAPILWQKGVNALHLTGKGIVESSMQYRKTDVSMASAALENEFEIYEANLEKIEQVVIQTRS
ncbi:MAG: copper homeostasis protein CutC [Spirosomaceae bacterium]|nr:copper homeostasis protein CutC [Spirosomataceae bacterium]